MLSRQLLVTHVYRGSKVDLLVSQGLLTSGPPHGHDDKHRGRNTSLAGAEDESEDDQAWERREGSGDHAGSAPAEEAEQNPPVDGETDQGPYGHYDQIGPRVNG